MASLLRSMLPRAAGWCAGFLVVAALTGASRAGIVAPRTTELGSASQSTLSAQIDPRLWPDGVPSVAPPALMRLIHPPAFHPPQRFGKPLSRGAVYTAQYFGGDCGVYGRDGLNLTYAESITGLSHPQGTATVGQIGGGPAVEGEWYVANTGASNIPVYVSSPKGPKGPRRTLNDPNQFPVDVDVSPKLGLVVVSNALDILFHSGSISVYRDGARSPSSLLSVKDTVQGVGVALDHRGDCYWSLKDLRRGVGEIVEFPGCLGPAVKIVSGLQNAGGMAFDGVDNLYYIDQSVGLYRCTGTSKCRLLTAGMGNPVFLNFDRKWKHIWLSDATGYIDVIDPLSGAVLASTPAMNGATNPPFGIALTPGAKF